MRTSGNRRDVTGRVGAVLTSTVTSTQSTTSSKSEAPSHPLYAVVASQAATVPNTDLRSGPPRGPVRWRNPNGGRPEISCYKCHGPHFLEMCPDFQSLSGEEMRNFLLVSGRCGVCCRFHPNLECTKTNVRCWICQGNHVAGVHKAAVVDAPAMGVNAMDAPEEPEEA